MDIKDYIKHIEINRSKQNKGESEIYQKTSDWSINKKVTNFMQYTSV